MSLHGLSKSGPRCKRSRYPFQTVSWWVLSVLMVYDQRSNDWRRAVLEC